MARFIRSLLAGVAVLMIAPAGAYASQMIDRNATHVSVAVNSQNRAVISYVRGGTWHHVLVWDAINARTPSRTQAQVKFRLDYSGGYGSFGGSYWKQVVKHDVCGPYTGPKLHWLVVACTMPNGQNWAVQSWQRMLPNSGKQPKRSTQSAHELHVSHWNGQLPVLWLKWDWEYGGRYQHLYGKFSYDDTAVHGFGATSGGNPTDSYGRNIYVDTLDPGGWNTGYRQPGGWMRFNSFLAHNSHGNFCAGLFGNMFGRVPKANGKEYRASAMGPGVTPIVFWQGPPPGSYSPGGFPLRSNGQPDYNALPTYASNPVLRYSAGYDRSFMHEEQDVAGAGDSCYKSAGY